MPNNDLSGVNVLVTRPAEQAANLAALIEQQGGKAVLFPLLSIEPLPYSRQTASLFNQLMDDDYIIFISANAVRCAQDYLQDSHALKARIGAIGKSTAKELDGLGIQVRLVPVKGQDSEALLAEAEMQQLSGRRVLIVRGEGGRELLAETLRARGAIVDYAEVYRRIKTDVQVDSLNDVDVITITSGEALNNLDVLARQQGNQRVFEIPLVVIHERIAKMAQQSGFSAAIAVTSEVSDLAIVNSLNELKQNGSLQRSER